jgi:hypothetical protein
MKYTPPVPLLAENIFSIFKILGSGAMNGYARIADVFRALGHPARLQSLDLLHAEGEACVYHFEAALGQRQSCTRSG